LLDLWSLIYLWLGERLALVLIPEDGGQHLALPVFIAQGKGLAQNIDGDDSSLYPFDGFCSLVYTRKKAVVCLVEVLLIVKAAQSASTVAAGLLLGEGDALSLCHLYGYSWVPIEVRGAALHSTAATHTSDQPALVAIA